MITLILQVIALVFLALATFQVGAVFQGKVNTLAAGLFFWLLSLMLTAVVLHPVH